MYSSQYPKYIDFILLWEPIIDLCEYLDQLFRINLTSQMTLYKKILYKRDDLKLKLLNNEDIIIEGYEFTKKMLTEFKETQDLFSRYVFNNPIYIAMFSKKKIQVINHILTLNDRNKIEYIKEKKIWSELKIHTEYTNELNTSSLNWIKKTYD